MIALLILSILLGLALPSYQRYVQRGQRAEAVRLLLAAAGCQERIRTQSGYYDTTRCLDGFEEPHYTLRIEPAEDVAATAFTLIAEPPRRAGGRRVWRAEPGPVRRPRDHGRCIQTERLLGRKVK